jgi:hypothetical protein
MSAFGLSRWWKRRARPVRPTTCRRARPQVEALEERLVQSTYYVVPGTADNVTTFGTLADCLNQAAIKNGDVIQIEPGSNPGHIVDADIPNLKNLTLQGDPNTDLPSLPYFYLDNQVSIDLARQGFTFKHVQFDITNGTLQLQANATITDCHVKEDYAGEAIEMDGVNAAVISDSYFESDNPNTQQHDFLRENSSFSSHNRITDNQFVALTGKDIILLGYYGSGGSSDIIAHNTFTEQTGTLPLLVVASGSPGLTIQGNTFNDGDPFGTAIEVVPDVQNLQIVDNVISFSNGGAGSLGIAVISASSTGPSSMVIADNHISTAGNGVGIEFGAQKPGITFDARVQDNDLHGNHTGVVLDSGGGGSLADIDLGGGTQGSLGANNFRGNIRAINTTALAAAGPIQAQMNIFGVADPKTVIYDHNNNSTLATVAATNPLTGNAAYVETLYLDLLHRTAHLNVANYDATGWVYLLDHGTPAAAVAGAIAHSPEALGVGVDGLYHRFLGHDADPAGRAGMVAYLQAGGTLEGVSQVLLASPDYQAHFHTDADFVQSLYQSLLHRTASNFEVSAWLNAMTHLGRAGVAQQLLASPESRAWEVTDDYAWFLHRAPGTAEVNAWVGSGMDLLTMGAFFAASPEFQQNG